MRLIIEAFNSYSKKKKGSLVVLGDGSEMSELRSLSKENDNIHLLGNVTNVLDYLLASDYFISSSFSEGLPNTVLEALSTGLATILSDIPSHLEIAEVCSSSCEIFSLKDGLTGLEQKMLNADKIFSLKSKAEAKEKANKFFSAKSMSLNYQNEYIRAVSIV
jgi:glycosyltransferase involved in cell wall biosynthesis